MVVSLRSRILFGYIILVAVIGSMAAILIHEPAKFHDLYAYFKKRYLHKRKRLSKYILS